MAGAEPADRKPNAADPSLVHFWTCNQVVQRADVVPENHSRPGETSGVNGSADKLLVLAGALVELANSLGRDAVGAVAPIGGITIQQQAPLAPVEHIDHNHYVSLSRE